VVVEAYNLACACIDADGLHTDDELWALTAAFGHRMGGDLARSRPADVRSAGLVAGRRAWLEEPSTMFGLLLDADARDGADRSGTYLRAAVAVAHAVAATDRHTSARELAAIEAWRGRLLDAVTRASSTASAGDGAAAGAGTTPAGTEAEPEVEDPPARPLDELLAELDALVGLADVKAEVHLVAALLQVQELRRQRGLPVMEQSRHLVFTGNPGTGKTTVARLLAQIYRTLQVVARGHLLEVDRSDLVAGYIGQTATRVVEVFDRADEGVLLIDEAYALARGGERDFGREAIDTIVKLIEDRRDRIVVIMAGYTDEMDELIATNPGLRSRFPKVIAFPDYSTDELMEILAGQADRGGYLLDDAATARARAWLEAAPRDRGFGNGRAVRNLFEWAVAAHARRVVDVEDPSDLVLVTLTGADLPHPGTGPSTGSVAAAAPP
jgi:Cdc6-like AAA superfamily ATPase